MSSASPDARPAGLGQHRHGCPPASSCCRRGSSSRIRWRAIPARSISGSRRSTTTIGRAASPRAFRAALQRRAGRQDPCGGERDRAGTSARRPRRRFRRRRWRPDRHGPGILLPKTILETERRRFLDRRIHGRPAGAQGVSFTPLPAARACRPRTSNRLFTIATGAAGKPHPHWRIFLMSLNLALSASDRPLGWRIACCSLSLPISMPTGRRLRPAWRLPARKGAERFVLLGDFVGYGADPEWVVDTVMGLVGRAPSPCAAIMTRRSTPRPKHECGGADRDRMDARAARRRAAAVPRRAADAGG